MASQSTSEDDWLHQLAEQLILDPTQSDSLSRIVDLYDFLSDRNQRHLLLRFMNHGDPCLREMGFSICAETGDCDSECATVAEKWYHCSGPSVRIDAMEILAELGRKSGGGLVIIPRALSDESQPVRLKAMEAIWAMGNDVIVFLDEHLSASGDLQHKKWLRSLLQFDSERSFDLEHLEERSSLALKYSAIKFCRSTVPIHQGGQIVSLKGVINMPMSAIIIQRELFFEGCETFYSLKDADISLFLDWVQDAHFPDDVEGQGS